MTNIENPLAYSFFMQEDIFLLNADKQALKTNTTPAPALPAPEPKFETPETSFKYRGSNRARYLIIAHYPEEDFMAEAHFAALAATLKRIYIDINDTAIFNLSKHPEAEFKQIAAFFQPQKMLILGKNALPGGIGIIPPHKAQPVNGISVLITFSFNGMMDNPENKKTFWEAMKLF